MSNLSGVSVVIDKNELSITCPFCNALTQTGDISRTLKFKEMFGNRFKSRLIWESAHFAIVPDLNPLVEGHLLIVAKQHFPSMAYLSTNLLEQLEKVTLKTRSILTQEYSECVFYEHGDTYYWHSGGDCVSHAHIHALPIGLNLSKEFNNHYIEREIESLVEISEQVPRQVSYIFFEDAKKARHIYDAPTMPCQYIRKTIAQKLNRSNRSNYRRFFPESLKDLEQILNNLERFKHLFNSI